MAILPVEFGKKLIKTSSGENPWRAAKKLNIFPKPGIRRAYNPWWLPMDRDQLEYIKEHYEELGVEVLAFTRRWALVKYGWESGARFGQSLEDIVMGVFDDYLTGTRQLKPGVEIRVQMKSAARSELWSLIKRKGIHATPIVEEGDEDEPPTSYASGAPGPDAQATSADLCQTILKLLWEHPKVKANDELAGYLLAVETGASTPAEIADVSEMPVARVYEARRFLNGIYPEIRKKLNKITEDSYER
jgi:hypothetical protein